MKQLINSEGRRVRRNTAGVDVFCNHCRDYWWHSFESFPSCWNCKQSIDLTVYRLEECIDGKLIDSRPAVLEDFK